MRFRGQSSDIPRHEARNRRRGTRARDHLGHMRRLERDKLLRRGRERERARYSTAPSTLLVRARQVALFGLSLAAGVALAPPLQALLVGLTGGELGNLETISIQGNERLETASVAAVTGVAPGSSLADVDPEQVEQTLERHAWIRDAHVLRLPPSTLLVRVSERQPLAVINDTTPGADAQPKWRLIDRSGIPFAAADASDVEALPHLRGGGELASNQAHPVLVTAVQLTGRVGDLLPPELHALAETLEIQLPTAGSAEGWVLRSREGTLEVVLGNDRLAERLDRLGRLLTAELPDVQTATRIDLRFADRAVLRGDSASG